MHHSSFTRIVSAVFALWFAVFTAEPVALHTCPVHDGPGGAASHMDHSMGAGTMHMDGSAAKQAKDAGGKSSRHEAGSKTCQCPGRCCHASPVALRSLPVLEEPAQLELAESGLPDYEYVAVSRSLLLPFANGPPAQRA